MIYSTGKMQVKFRLFYFMRFRMLRSGFSFLARTLITVACFEIRVTVHAPHRASFSSSLPLLLSLSLIFFCTFHSHFVTNYEPSISLSLSPSFPSKMQTILVVRTCNWKGRVKGLHWNPEGRERRGKKMSK